MAKLILLLGLVVLSCCAPNYAFEYLGFYVNSDYWIGDTPMAATGKITPHCVENFGNGSTVVIIGNVNEWNWIKDRLAAVRPCTGCTTNFWTSGKWDVKYPADDSLVISITGTTVTTKVLKRTNQFKYICETPPSTNTQDPPANPTPVNACLNDNDVIFVLDSSGSIGASYYKKGKVFAYDLARAFANRPTSRFGFTIYSSSVRKIAALNNNLSAADLHTAILNADYMANGTLTNLAIDSAIAEFADSTRTVTKNLVILTDGESNLPSATLTSIGNAINLGIRTFAVGVGSSTSQQELLALAGGNKNRLFTANSFDELTALLNPLNQVICDPDTSTDTCHQDININTLLNNEQKLKLVQLLLCTCKR